jgi:hypothetical protein
VNQLFIDFKKFYDSVKRKVFYNILLEFGVPKKLVRLEASKDVGLEINAKKTKYMIMSHHPNRGQNQNMIAKESFENVAKFKYLGITQIRMTFMMKSRVN